MQSFSLNLTRIFFVAALFIYPTVCFTQTVAQYDSLCTIKEKKHDLQAALQLINKAVELDSNYYRILQHRGNIEASLGDYKGSIADFTRAIALSPSAGGYYLRGISYYQLKDYPDAMADFDKAAAQQPDLTYELFFFRGNIKFKQQDYAGSIAEYTKAIDMKPGYAKGYYNRGVSKYYANLKGDACADVAKAKELGFTDVDPIVEKYCDYYGKH